MAEYEIDLEAARIAHEANSMRDFDPNRELGGYRAEVEEAYRMAEEQAERFPEAAEKARALAEKFARRYAEWLNEGYAIDAMCPSVLVSGGGNFPTKRKARQNARRDAHMGRYEEVMAIRRRIKTVGTGGIQSGDENAVERLEAKAKRLEERQDLMKRTNAFYRRHGTLKGFDGLGEEEAAKAEADMKAFGYGQPFPSYALSNNSANIRRTRKRIEELKREKEAPEEERETTINGEECRIVENSEIMRLQLVFEGKPEPGTRDMLKQADFRWSPRNGAWQRQLTDNARRALKGLEGRTGGRMRGTGDVARNGRGAAGMDYTYEGRIENVEGDWLVTFPQFEGAFGGGKTVAKACRNAAEALRLRIASMVDDGQPLPRARFSNHPHCVFTVEVDASYIDATKTVSFKEAADMLGVTKGRVSTLVKDGKLDTVLVDGRSRVTIASVNERIQNPPAPHRPRRE